MNKQIKESVTKKKKIQEVAEKLFLTTGYEATSVNTIVEKANVAKGTFYHHFETKEAVLDAIVNDLLDALVSSAEGIAINTSLSPVEKINEMFSNQNTDTQKADTFKESLHLPENRELHEKVNVQMVLRFSPILSEIIEQGVKEKTFKVTNTLETVQFLLVASQFLFDEGLFKWDSKEWQVRRKVMQDIIEVTLGAKKGSFTFITNN